MNITKMKCFTITITIIKIQFVKFILTKDTMVLLFPSLCKLCAALTWQAFSCVAVYIFFFGPKIHNEAAKICLGNRSIEWPPFLIAAPTQDDTSVLMYMMMISYDVIR